jgi:nitroreductase
MEVKEAIMQRQSIRNFEDKQVPEEKLLKVLEAARLAPSASNQQPYKFVVVRDSAKRRALAEAAGGQKQIAAAPVVIAAVTMMPDYTMYSGVPAYAVDCAIALDHITLAAVDEGLGTCWIGAFSQEKVREIMKIPESYKVVALLPLGYPKQIGSQKIRKPLSELVCYETFKE